MARPASAPRRHSATALTPDQRVDHRIVSGLLDAWLLELDTNRNWQKNLMIYASAISDGVHNLMTMESAPAEVRARRIIDEAGGRAGAAGRRARQHRQSAAGDGRARRAHVEGRLVDVEQPIWPSRLPIVQDPKLKAELAAPATTAATAIDAFVAWFEKEKLPKRERSVHGRPRESRGALPRRGADRSAGAARSWRSASASWRRTRRRSSPRPRAWTSRRPALAVWADVLNDHPRRGAGRRRGAEGGGRAAGLRRWRSSSSTCRPSETVNVAPAREFDLGPGVDARLAAARGDAGEELLLHHRRAGVVAARRSRTSGCRSSTTRRSP